MLAAAFEIAQPEPSKPISFTSVAFEIEVDSQLIAAEWIKAFSGVISRFELAKVSRLLVMVEDYLLVEFA